jgi:predicted metal-binding membrane protein
MSANSAYPLARERNLIFATLLILAAAAWGFLIWQATMMDTTTMMGGALTMGLGAPLFLAIWVAMMVAMMFPTAAPMILMFAAIHAGNRQRERAFVPTWIFVSAYLVVWALFGVLAYAVATGLEYLAGQTPWVMDNAGRLGGAVLVLAGLYQLSPLKHACLAKCRTPRQFILSSWRDGYGGAFRMGLAHGIYCLGCCWLLFVILFPLGVMNIALMAIITLLIFAEKALPLRWRLGEIAALILIGYGALVILRPDLLPTLM